MTSNIELLNCLEEATARVRELSASPAVIGDPSLLWSLVESYAYYCKSTDAFAGWVTARITYYANRDLAEAAAAAAYHDHDDCRVELRGPKPAPAAVSDDDGVPF